MDLPDAPRPPDHVVLRALLTSSPSWKLCASVAGMAAYCRVMPPAFPRRPLVVDTEGHHFREAIAPQ
jgi:hypothetical protein